MPKRHIGKEYIHIRIRNPNRFKPKSYKTLDIGRKGFHKLIRGRLKKNNEWRTQKVLIERKYANLMSVKKETRKIIKRAKAER